MWEKNLTGKDVLIAQMDTGADSTHPTLKNAINDARMISDDGNDSHEEIPYADTSSHGTHTAGIIAGRSDTGGPVVGMAPDANLVCATVINEGETFARLLAGMNFALEANARILNISLGIEGFDGSLQGVMETVRTQQLLPVVAIGNNPLSSYSPGNYATVLSVGASDKDDYVAPFSSSAKRGDQGVGPVLCAPGKNIYSSVPGNKYETKNGSSMAAPHVAGLAALLLNDKPDATIDQIQEALVASCENRAGDEEGRIGAGIPNGLKALKILERITS
jgi:subtilisin family serine protease